MIFAPDLSYGGHYDGHLGGPRDIVRSLRYLPLTAEPRVRWQYDDFPYFVTDRNGGEANIKATDIVT